MRLLLGVTIAAAFHGLAFGVGLALLPRPAMPAPVPAQVDVDVVVPPSEPADRPSPPTPPATAAGGSSQLRSRRPRALAFFTAPPESGPLVTAPPESGALVTAPPESGPLVTAAAAHSGDDPMARLRSAVPAPRSDVTPAQPQYKSNPPPAYPIASHRRHEEGTVLLKVAVSADGLPTAVSLERSCGHQLLDDAALETVRRWTFAPARADGVAFASVVLIPVRFATAQADR